MNNSKTNNVEKTPVRRVLGNLGFLVRGRGGAALLSLGSTVLMARTLGPSEFGIIMLTLAYTLLIRVLFDFQLFESIIKFGVAAQETNNSDKLQRLLSVCWKIDKRVSLSATLVGLVLVPVIGIANGLESLHILLMALYSLVLLSSGTGTAVGVLRLFDQFSVLGNLMVVGPAIRFVGVVIVWWFDGSIAFFMLVVGVAYISENLFLIGFGWHEYKAKIGKTAKNKSKCDIKDTEFNNVRSFMKVTYWQSNLDVAPKHIILMLAGVLLGTAEAGLLRLAREFSSILSNPAILIRQVLYLDLTRSWHNDRTDIKSLTYITAAVAAGLGFFFVMISFLFGDVLLEVSVGKEYIAAWHLLTFMLLAATFEITASSLRSASYAIGKASAVLRLYTISSIIYISFFVGLTWWVGLIGAGIAASLASVIPPVFMFAMIYKSNIETTAKANL